MNSVGPHWQAASIVCGCYAIGFIAAPLLSPLCGPVNAILVAMTGSSVLAVVVTRVARRRMDRTARERKP